MDVRVSVSGRGPARFSEENEQAVLDLGIWDQITV